MDSAAFSYSDAPLTLSPKYLNNRYAQLYKYMYERGGGEVQLFVLKSSYLTQNPVQRNFLELNFNMSSMDYTYYLLLCSHWINQVSNRIKTRNRNRNRNKMRSQKFSKPQYKKLYLISFI
jgi:hypothetical protein